MKNKVGISATFKTQFQLTQNTNTLAKHFCVFIVHLKSNCLESWQRVGVSLENSANGLLWTAS